MNWFCYHRRQGRLNKIKVKWYSEPFYNVQRVSASQLEHVNADRQWKE